MVRRGMLGIPLIVLAACDVPSGVPGWEQTWVVPGDSIALGVAELLPSGLALTEDSSAFLVDIGGTAVSLSLGELCGAPCQAADGAVVPKPPFTETLTTAAPLPEGVVAASLTGGAFDLTLSHDLGFDPLRPSTDPAADRGYLVVRIEGDGEVVAFDSIDGADRAFPAGTSLTPSLPVRPVEVGGQLTFGITLHSPAGDPVLIDTSDTIGVALAPSTLEVSRITIQAPAIVLPGFQSSLDLGRLEEQAVLDAVDRGALLVRIHNPFEVTGALELTVELDGRTIQRTLPVQPGDAGERLELSGSELRDLVTSDRVDLSVGGTLSPTEGTVTIAPTQVLVLAADLELVVHIGGGGGR